MPLSRTTFPGCYLLPVPVLDVAGTTVAIGDVAAQAEQVMDNLRTALRAAGADLQEPLSRDRQEEIRTYLTSQRSADSVPD